MALNRQPGAWAVIFCPTTRAFLLGRRSSKVKKPGVWNFFGGRVDEQEEPLTALRRELQEEAGFMAFADGKVSYGGASPVSPTLIGFVDGLRQLHYFLLPVDHEAIPVLNDEHSEYGWFQPEAMPSSVNRATRVAIQIGLVQKAILLSSSGTEAVTVLEMDSVEGDEQGN